MNKKEESLDNDEEEEEDEDSEDGGDGDETKAEDKSITETAKAKLDEQLKAIKNKEPTLKAPGAEDKSTKSSKTTKGKPKKQDEHIKEF